MTISDATREFVDDIDDVVVKLELVHAIATIDAIAANATSDLRSEEFSRAFDRSMEGYMKAVSNQKASLNRLLDERRQNIRKIHDLEQQLEACKDDAYGDGLLKVGPE